MGYDNLWGKGFILNVRHLEAILPSRCRMSCIFRSYWQLITSKRLIILVIWVNICNWAERNRDLRAALDCFRRRLLSNEMRPPYSPRYSPTRRSRRSTKTREGYLKIQQPCLRFPERGGKGAVSHGVGGTCADCFDGNDLIRLAGGAPPPAGILRNDQITARTLVKIMWEVTLGGTIFASFSCYRQSLPSAS